MNAAAISSAKLIVKDAAARLGFDLCGIAPVEIDAENLAAYERWLERGWHGEMRYMEREQRRALTSLLPTVRSVICVGLVYNTPLPYSGSCGHATRGWIARYAWGDDYHEVMRTKLERLVTELRAAIAVPFDARICVDSAPVLERALARAAGLGWIAKNTCVINERTGSWIFLGEVLTSLELAPDAPAPDRCGSCTRCLDACPTQAFVAPCVLDATRCISYFTIELKGAIPEPMRDRIGQNIFGCDICQDVCPWNRDAPVTLLPEFQPRLLPQSGATQQNAAASAVRQMRRSPLLPSVPPHENASNLVQIATRERERSPAPCAAEAAPTASAASASPAGSAAFPLDAACAASVVNSLPSASSAAVRDAAASSAASGASPENFAPSAMHSPMHPISPGQLVRADFSEASAVGKAAGALPAHAPAQAAKAAADSARGANITSPSPNAALAAASHTAQRSLQADPAGSTRAIGANNAQPTLFNPPLAALASLTEDEFRTLFRGSPVKRSKYRGLLRNIAVAMGNVGPEHAEEFRPLLERLACSAAAANDPLLREHVLWALRRLSANRG